MLVAATLPAAPRASALVALVFLADLARARSSVDGIVPYFECEAFVKVDITSDTIMTCFATIA